ncbi:ankyrin repeat domain-containing protein 49-like [Stegodyphus dumicola]|uniref:ankyrin repeat domain-containing protein 49-like n=1 Tax=Stegodyphus dumicola TaxID=202533 RepID=UPI0015A9246C|nr:ankyrin repeat domain-containing protein 49-like [Stegodyphus dumicola]
MSKAADVDVQNVTESINVDDSNVDSDLKEEVLESTGDEVQEKAETEKDTSDSEGILISDSGIEANQTTQPDDRKCETSAHSERQSSVEDKSKWSYSQWSENYESLEDEKPIEDLDGDPKKMILWAAEKNELETLRRLLEEDSELVNTRDNDEYTPLHRASYSNNVEVIKILLSYDADVSATTIDGWQPLHCACKWDSVEAVSLLLQNGADVNAQTKGHITPLHLAASNVSGRRTLELLLWQPYVDPNIKNDSGDTAYDIACRNGPLGALFEILEESVNVY